jgi:Family of unknown function (DUF6455)
MTGAPEAFDRMFRQSGLSPHDAVGRECDLAVAAARCSSCASARECAALLDAGRLRDARALCPNAAFFGRLECANARHSERKRGQTFWNLLLFLLYVAIIVVVAYFFWGLLA